MRRALPLLLLLALLAAPAAAIATGAEDVPAPLTPPPAGRLSERYPVWNYTLDGDYSYQDMAGRLLGTGLNALMLARAWLVYTALRGVEYALRADLVQPLAGAAADVQARLVEVLWHADDAVWVTGALVAAGGLGLLLWLFGRRTRALRTLAGAGATLLVALWLLAALPAALSAAQGFAHTLIQSITSPLVALLPGSGAAHQRLLDGPGEALWRTLVFEPWVWGEFGGQAAAGNYPGADGLPGTRLLAMLPSERQTYYGQVPYQLRGTDYTWWTADYTGRRLLTAALLLLIAGAVVGVVLLLAGEVILWQFFLVLWLALSPVWLLAALWWPGGGLWLLRRWLLRGLAALLLPMVAAFTLAAYLVLALSLGRAFTGAGWLLTGSLQALLAIATFRMRRGWGAAPRNPLRIPLPRLVAGNVAVAVPAGAGGPPATEAVTPTPWLEEAPSTRRRNAAVPVRPRPAVISLSAGTVMPPTELAQTPERAAATVLPRVERELSAIRFELLRHQIPEGPAPIARIPRPAAGLPAPPHRASAAPPGPTAGVLAGPSQPTVARRLHQVIGRKTSGDMSRG